MGVVERAKDLEPRGLLTVLEAEFNPAAFGLSAAAIQAAELGELAILLGLHQFVADLCARFLHCASLTRVPLLHLRRPIDHRLLQELQRRERS